MRKDKLLMGIILLLVLLNSATLIIMWVNKPPFPPHHPPQHEPPGKIIIERLKLDEHQQKEFEKLKKEHHSQMVKLDEQSRELHQNYFTLLEKETINDSIVDSYEKQLASITEQKEEITFNHFRDLKNICKGNQIQLFNDFVGELGKLLSIPPPPKPSGPPH